MADISKIKLPDGNTYNLKDANATDTKVTQVLSESADGNEYRLLLSKSDTSLTETDTVQKTRGFSYKPSTDSMYGSYLYLDGMFSVRDGNEEVIITQGGVYTNRESNLNGVKLPHTYSATEQIVGYWIDGKPIYEQTITLSNITLTQNAEYQHSVLLIGIDQPIKIEAVISLTNGTDKRTIPVGLQTTYHITVNFTRDVIGFRRGSGTVSGATIYATIQYTKT